jgi:hypothetical protein
MKGRSGNHTANIAFQASRNGRTALALAAP